MAYKVLIIASTFSHIKQFHMPYVRAFRARGDTVHIAAGGEQVPMPEADKVLPLPFEKKMWAPGNFRAASALRREIKAEGYDLVMVHTSLAAFFTRLAVRGMKGRPRLVNMVHGYLFDDASSFMRRTVLLSAERMMAGVTDLLLCMNRWDLALAERYRLGAAVAYVPGIGVDPSRFQAPDKDAALSLRRRYGIDEDAFLMLYAAEFSPRKSQAVLIRAAAGLPERAVLVLPGSGELLESCRALAESLGAGGRIIFPGQVGNMEQWYAAADAAVTASRSEGLPFNVMEAMFCGLPVIASDVKGNSDLVRDGETGILFPYGDDAAAAAAMETLMADSDLCCRMGEAGRRAVGPFSLEEVFPQVMGRYDSLLQDADR